MPGSSIERNPLIRGRLYKFLNLGLSLAGVIFVVIGVFKSTLLLYIGCALLGAAIGGFIRSRLPINAMVPSTGVHLIYRSELRRDMPVSSNGLQTYVIMHSQQPCGIGQKKINQYTKITKFLSTNTPLNADSYDTVSVISAITDKAESSDNCCIVCLIQFKDGQELRQLPCQHVFHINCIDKWLKINRMCPTCRADVTVPCMSKKAAMSGVHSQRRTTSDENVGVLDDQCNQDATQAHNTERINMSNPEIREDQLGNDADVTQELTSCSGDVVINVAEDTSASL